MTERPPAAVVFGARNVGRAVVAEGGREPMESHVAAMHSYGLWATLESSG